MARLLKANPRSAELNYLMGQILVSQQQPAAAIHFLIEGCRTRARLPARPEFAGPGAARSRPGAEAIPHLEASLPSTRMAACTSASPAPIRNGRYRRPPAGRWRAIGNCSRARRNRRPRPKSESQIDRALKSTVRAIGLPFAFDKRFAADICSVQTHNSLGEPFAVVYLGLPGGRFGPGTRHLDRAPPLEGGHL